MIEIFQDEPAREKQREIHEFLKSYWMNDVWNAQDAFFDKLRLQKRLVTTRSVHFSTFPLLLRDEVKFMFGSRLQNQEIKLMTVIEYGSAIKRLGRFLSTYYPSVVSIVNIPFNKAQIQWRTFLIEEGIKVDSKYVTNSNQVLFNIIFSFFLNYYDTREETEKDIWDVRKIPGTRITENKFGYSLNFSKIPIPFRSLTKRYLKFRITIVSHGQGAQDLACLVLFFGFMHERHPTWKGLRDLTRKDMEAYLFWYRAYAVGWKEQHYKFLIGLDTFLKYIQRAQYPEAAELPSFLLLFKEDLPRLPQRTENDIKYIPDGVLQQLEEHIEQVSPAEYIPVVILLRASGWRISDILNLRYDKCLDRTSQGWYLCGDINKTQVLNHRVPVTDQVALVVQAVVEEVKGKNTLDNNPSKLLFVRFNGKRKGHCPAGQTIRKALNRLAKQQNIVDDQGHVFHFGNHAFRHTKAVELINNGMNLLHVQKWMAHASPEMTLRYARILDTTMQKSWEEATKHGLFRINESGKHTKIRITDIQNEDLVEWEYIRSNLDSVRMPLGYCMKPKKQECHTQLIPCLTCRNLCTTPDFIPQYELEINETRAMVERGKAQGRSAWMEKNQTLLERYESILAILQEGKIHHKARKKGREYAGGTEQC